MEKKKVSHEIPPLWRKVMIAYLALAAYMVLFFAIAGEDIELKTTETDMVTAIGNVGEILDDRTLEQNFTAEQQKLTGVIMSVGTYSDREGNEGTLTVEVKDESGNVLASCTKNVAKLSDGENEFVFDNPITEAEGKSYVLSVSADGTSEGKAVTINYGYQEDEEHLLVIDGEESEQELLFSVVGKVPDAFGPFFKWGLILGLAALGLYLLYLPAAVKKGKNPYGMRIINAFHQYRFLMGQLVSRDFKVRYKRSILGVMWSFMNPLLTMIVQYFVFSTIFRSGIKNYIAYLLIGITFFNFYIESTNNGLLSITSNASLIKKVYVPKYIYPVSKTMSASINFAISIGLMLIISFITGVRPTRYFLLLPYVIVCIFILNIGVSLILATYMVFFHDVQFIYSIMVTLLSYATPMFWDMSMMPAKYQQILQLNPLCAIITCARSLLLDGRFMGSRLAVYALVIPLVLFLFGAYVFRKHQDEFVLYI